MGDKTAFFYGTLMAREILHRVLYGPSFSLTSPSHAPSQLLASQLTITPALLPSYCRHKVRHADYPGIVASPAHEVRGTYVTGLTAADVWKLDRFEGDEYALEDVTVTLLADEEGKGEGKKGEQRTTKSYVYTAGRHRLEDEEWDYEVFRREKLWRWTGQGSDEEYKDVDEAAVKAPGGAAGDSLTHDPTGGRRTILTAGTHS
ncbi:uncharacterized protein L3040_001058 [Drepanopeziza brunnea f. sp. 'multigermtubi']|uniref:uncharacterized protein n=1 Tax=Drepanopeziza brunnea f. sp. 'multigermtubi' TaxID=698441 RepID=UPI00238EAE7A|nr:hypothetical protein L3040_001058 [Drepanopeziza brunnea f. sp. 'multigermtubi']